MEADVNTSKRKRLKKDTTPFKFNFLDTPDEATSKGESSNDSGRNNLSNIFPSKKLKIKRTEMLKESDRLKLSEEDAQTIRYTINNEEGEVDVDIHKIAEELKRQKTSSIHNDNNSNSISNRGSSTTTTTTTTTTGRPKRKITELEELLNLLNSENKTDVCKGMYR